MFPFAPRPEATDLPKRKAFVPLMHQAVRWLAGVQSASRRSLLAGDNFVFCRRGRPAGRGGVPGEARARGRRERDVDADGE